ncbi:hypothetical protein BMS3Bbin07_00286 [bacterium BMS3Bbin07]|nr:hypothetical protein BMS3Bbin07_00286 [bacterium BMS3Bbin07]HDH01761.1 DUF3368 domain-containing protein [Nitrospirota bacterium]
MKKLIVSDATPIISFSRIGKLELFHQIVGEILIPEEVSRELFEYKKADVKSIKHCKWINVGAVKSKSDVELLMPTLDRGESEVIILSKELKASLVIIDELSARKVAMMLNLPLIGTVGLLIAARKKGLIDKVKPVWDKMIAQGVRYGEEFYRKVLSEIGEGG